LSSIARYHLATNARDSTAVEIRIALERVGLSRYITNVFCYREVGAEKPSRAFYSRILEILDCEPQEVLMVGDDLQKDVVGAMDCGIQAILYNPTGAAVPRGIRAVKSLLDLLPGESPHQPRSAFGPRG
jgi:putative hydrolase of the HAD superfamily